MSKNCENTGRLALAARHCSASRVCICRRRCEKRALLRAQWHARRLAVAVLLAPVEALAQTPVQVWLTRGDQVSLLEQRPSLTFAAGSGANAVKIDVDPNQRYQSIDGFGAAMTESSAYVVQTALSPSQQEAWLDALFSPTVGIGMSVIRVPMGSSDFALSTYTYCDLPPGQTDPNLVQFSIARDQQYVIPALQSAFTRNPTIRIFATPWTAPPWMKTNSSFFGGSLRTQWYATYARYFLRFTEAYAAAGLPIHAVTPQNEPLRSSGSAPTMTMDTFQQSTFIGDHLGPTLAAAGAPTKILCYDHNWDVWNYPVVVMNDSEAEAYTAGSAFHGYAGDVANQSLVHAQRPEKEIHFTEITGGDWATNWADNLVWSLHNVVIGATRHWARSVMYWNLALNQNDGPVLPGGCSGCRGVTTVNSSTGQFSFEVEYYALAHVSKFVKPGAVRIASTTIDGTVESVAFRNPDGSEVLIALNPVSTSRWFDLRRRGQFVSYRLVGKSVATFVYRAVVPGDFNDNGVLDFDDIDDGIDGNGNSLFDYLGAPPPMPEHDLVTVGLSAGVIDVLDLDALVEAHLGSVMGDLDRDNAVGIADVASLLTGLGAVGGYFEGDLTADRAIDMADVQILQVNFGRVGSP